MTLIVSKQSELTQLNRDNASLVGEVGEHRKQAKQLEKAAKLRNEAGRARQ
ncbi:MAG: hypothetical protein R3F38_08075 [Gammaproteobacteria bacterium]